LGVSGLKRRLEIAFREEIFNWVRINYVSFSGWKGTQIIFGYDIIFWELVSG